MEFRYEPLELRTRNPFKIARAASVAVRSSVAVRVSGDDGFVGMGEAAVTTPYYGETRETALAVLPLMASVAEEVSCGDASRLECIEAALAKAIGGNGAARAGLLTAYHDLHARRLGVPLWRLWGLEPRAARSSFTIGIDRVERVRQQVREAGSYPILKVKVGTSDDEEILRAIRDEAPHSVLRVDANTVWTAKEAAAALPMLEEYQVELLEQPLHPLDLDGLRSLGRRSRIPLVADESCRFATDIPRLAGLVDVVNIKLAKSGGPAEALRMIHVARAHHLKVMLGCMIESTLGIAAAVQLAPLADYVDLDGAALLSEDPFDGPGIEADGTVRFNSDPGLGVRRIDSIGSIA